MNISKDVDKQTLIKILAGVVAIVLLGIVYFAVQVYKEKTSWLSVESVEAKSTDFVNSELLQGKGTATVKVIGKEGNLYKLEVVYNGQTLNSFVSKDGTKFFPQSLEMIKNAQTNNQVSTTQTNSETAATPVDVEQTDKPVVELFVMSYCPYGTQIEKGILPVVKTLGNKIDYQLKFVDYAMHGEKELKENLVQYCIQKEQTPKFDAYLTCFLKASDSASCLTSAGVDIKKNDACVAKTDGEFKVTANFKSNTDFRGTFPGFNVEKSDNTKYSVGGSPTLIINGKDVSAGRDSASLLKAICSAFKTQPKECETALSSVAPAAGFGEGAAPSGGSGSGCGQ